MLLRENEAATARRIRLVRIVSKHTEVWSVYILRHQKKKTAAAFPCHILTSLQEGTWLLWRQRIVFIGKGVQRILYPYVIKRPLMIIIQVTFPLPLITMSLYTIRSEVSSLCYERYNSRNRWQIIRFSYYALHHYLNVGPIYQWWNPTNKSVNWTPGGANVHF